MSDTVPYDDLDPGIRHLVRLLNDHGFKTCDSGDGRSKFDERGEPLPGWGGCAMDIPHVVVRCDADGMADECDRIRDVLLAAGVPLDVQRPDGDAPCIQGTYDPSSEERTAFILVLGADDSSLSDA